MPEPIVVHKLGGSLLERTDLADVAHRVLDAATQRPLIVVGGGAVVDVVRAWDARYRLGERRSHGLAIEAMRLTARLVVNLLPTATLVANRDEAASSWGAGRRPVLDVSRFLRAEPCPLPESWDATSDSLAAWIATVWPADELVLWKSRPRPAGLDWTELADCGLVDGCFAEARRSVPSVRWMEVPP